MSNLRCHLLIGPPASGKTSISKILAPIVNAKILSTDAIREELWGDEMSQGPWEEIEEVLHARLKDYVSKGQSVIIDATHAKRSWRLAFTQKIRIEQPIEWIGWWIKTPPEVCLKWNQKRERVIFVGVRNDITEKFEYPIETHNKDGTDGKLKWVSVKEAIDDLKDLPEDSEKAKELQQIYTKHTPKFIEKIKQTEIGTSVLKKYSESFYRCYPDRPSNTVKENHGGVFVHYEKNRVMTPRELARLQSFPDEFVFKGTKSSMLIQLGNAVPVDLAKALAEEVKNVLN